MTLEKESPGGNRNAIQNNKILAPNYTAINAPNGSVCASFPCARSKKPMGGSWKDQHKPMRKGAAYLGVSPPETVLIVDVDAYKNASITAELESAIGCVVDWEGSRLQDTPNGGSHHAFTIPADAWQSIPNSKDTKGIIGLDIRAPHKGYICTGKGYACPFGDAMEAMETHPWPEMPASMLEWLTRPTGKPAKASVDDTATVPPESPQNALQGVPDDLVCHAVGQRNDKIMALVRWFRINGFARSDLRQAFDDWHERSVGNMRNINKEDNWLQTMQAYEACRLRPGMGLDGDMDAFFADVLDDPTPAWLPEYMRDSQDFAAIGKMIERLHKGQGDMPVFLACRTIEQYAGINKNTAARRMKALFLDGVLAMERMHTTNAAARFYLAR